jgi:SAM-dependent methyltransferase
MELDEVGRNWELFATSDPHWAVLSATGTRGGGWDLDAFFAQGVDEIGQAQVRLARLGLDVKPGRALDFGCGVGRLSQPLARWFDRCDGVDIAPSMVERARRLDDSDGRCVFHVNRSDRIGLFADCTFDFIYSSLVLQHMEPRFALGYLAEFCRLLAPGGVIMVQIPSRPLRPDELTVEPLPVDARVAEVDLPAGFPKRIVRGTQCSIAVGVTNRSAMPWPEGASLQVGNHWLDELDNVLQFDDGRAPLPSVDPGQRVDVTIQVTAPPRTGRYRVALDVVQEGIAWFGDATGGVTAPTKAARWGSRGAQVGVEVPVMETHGVEPAIVEDALRVGGLSVVGTEPTGFTGGWEGSWYVARKPDAADRA